MPRSNQRQPSAFSISQSRRKRNSIATFGIASDMPHQVDRRLLAEPRRHQRGEGDDLAIEAQQRRALGADVARLEGAEREGLLAAAARGQPCGRDRRQPVDDRGTAAGGEDLHRHAVAGAAAQHVALAGAVAALEVEGARSTRACSPSL